MYIFDVTAQQGRWLAVKQATIATNVSNANTPGYKAQEVRPFDEVLDRTRLTLASTHAGHLDAGGADVRSAVTKAADPWEVSHSGNSVSLEQERWPARPQAPRKLPAALLAAHSSASVPPWPSDLPRISSSTSRKLPTRCGCKRRPRSWRALRLSRARCRSRT